MALEEPDRQIYLLVKEPARDIDFWPIKSIFTKFQDNFFKFEPIGAVAKDESLADEADDVIVTEEDIDEELIEIDIDLSYDNSEVIQESVIRKVEKEVDIQVHEEEKQPPLPTKVITE